MAYERHRAAGKPYRTRPAGNVAYLKHESASLRCRAAQHGGCRNTAGITYYGFERALLDAALHIALDDNAFARTDELARISGLLFEKTQALGKAQKRASNLMLAWADDGDDKSLRDLADTAKADAGRLR
jgi:hypothetical protein